MKIMCSPNYHHNDFVATHVLGHMMHGYTLLVPMNNVNVYVCVCHESFLCPTHI